MFVIENSPSTEDVFQESASSVEVLCEHENYSYIHKVDFLPASPLIVVVEGGY